MITNTQYALLVGVPTFAIIVAAVISSLALRRFLRIMNASFDRFEQNLATAEAKHAAAAKSAFATEGN